MDFNGVKARSALGTSAPVGIQVCGAAGRETCCHSRPLLLPCGWLFPPAKANSSSDTVPGRLSCGRRPWHTAKQGMAPAGERCESGEQRGDGAQALREAFKQLEGVQGQGLAELHLQLGGAGSDALNLPRAPCASVQGSCDEMLA